MANVEHVDIQDPQIHEPKGVLAATDGEVYVADGALSGAWAKLLATFLDTGAATTGQHFIADGVGGGVFKDTSNVHGEMFVTGYTTALAVPAAGDATLDTDTDYIKITASSMWQAGDLHGGMSFNVDELVVPVAGHY